MPEMRLEPPQRPQVELVDNNIVNKKKLKFTKKTSCSLNSNFF